MPRLKESWIVNPSARLELANAVLLKQQMANRVDGFFPRYLLGMNKWKCIFHFQLEMTELHQDFCFVFGVDGTRAFLTSLLMGLLLIYVVPAKSLPSFFGTITLYPLPWPNESQHIFFYGEHKPQTWDTWFHPSIFVNNPFQTLN